MKCVALSEALSVSGPRGALHIGDVSQATVFALLDDGGRTREVAFCSPHLATQRTTIHALDDDTFDLGIGTPHVDMLVRLDRADVVTRSALRQSVGQALLTAGSAAAAAIARASPTRIFVSALARLEVHQPIPPPGGRSPAGPHSHLLPNHLREGHLREGHLREGRAHAPGSPLPAGLYCGLSLYPSTTL